MKTGDMVIYKGLVNPELNVKLEGDKELHKMHVWDEKQELVFWWEPLPAMLEGRVYRFGFTLKDIRKNRIECSEETERNLNIEQLHCVTVACIRNVFGEV